MLLYPVIFAGMTEEVSLPVELLMTLFGFLWMITVKVRYATFLASGYCIYPLPKAV
jgi:hypothetical protein